MNTFNLKLPPILQLSDEQFYQLSQINRDVDFERSVTGELIIMSPTGGETGRRNAVINLELGLWNRINNSGIVFDSSTGFKLPNGAVRSPDVAWIPKEKWLNLSKKQREGFIPICPDFVIELLSSSDSLTSLQQKMQEYLDNGATLGWLVNAKTRQVEIYRRGQEKEILDKPNFLSGEAILSGFNLETALIW
ncbi:Uma2 family endonuclease [Gloeocapsa sp. PCC 73106]|uniref:Uma2 family endonuclease n=1 Tax=Gloeocapsa sp. PCC 73106 TaxID=102232 RepID=UPI0002ABDDE2|nr:Uma2 family endonuclease [Gloeocapsa sp. PCC 73106]ELR97705.1 hypothetical protein GLO73106DRAFT_00015180 [Gloeocapsa sp. PCC 73106]